MIRILTAYDDNDDELGDFLQMCYKDISDFAVKYDSISLMPLNGLMCTEAEIEASVNSFNKNRFIFIGFAHGLADCLATVNGKFVSTNNCELFENSLFYSTSCLSARKLGPQLIRAGCISFIGYKSSIFILDDFSEVFILCKNSGIKRFLSEQCSITEAFYYMHETYQNNISLLQQGTEDEFLAASILNKNKKALTILGDEPVTASQFDV